MTSAAVALRDEDPRAAFRGELRRRRLGELERRPARIGRIRVLIAAYARSDLALLTVAIVGPRRIGSIAS